MAADWALWSELGLFAGDPAFYSSGYATDEEFVLALAVINAEADLWVRKLAADEL